MKKNILKLIVIVISSLIYYFIADEIHTIQEIAVLSISLLIVSIISIIKYKRNKEDLDKIDEGYKFYQNKLLQSQKMEVISEFSRGIAHDFNNMLTSINGYVDLLDIDLSNKTNKTKEYLNGIRKNIESASSLTNKLMTFSKNQIIDVKVININSVINEFYDVMSKTAGENIALQLKLNSVTLIKADKGQIEQILLNLVLNAKDAIKETFVAEPKILIETYDTPTGSIIIRCSDNGIGMTEETKERLFEPFFTTKPFGKGLGLTSIYGIVNQNHGIINVYSELNKGTTFEIFLPTTRDILDKTEKTYGAKTKKGNGEKILFVEDNKSIRDVFSQYLTKCNYKIIIAENGKDAMSKLDGIDLIITDIVMPEMGGCEFAEKAKEINPNIKIIFTSGYAEPDEEFKYFLIKKPYTLDTILQKIQKILSE